MLTLHLPLLLEREPPPRAQRLDAVPHASLTVKLLALEPTRSRFADRDLGAPRQRRAAAPIQAAAPAPGTSREPVIEAISSPPPTPAPTQAAASASEPGRLDLSLPPRAARGSAATPTVPSARPRSVEAILDRGLAQSPLIEESLGNGRLRIRRGRDCIDLRDTRMAQIDPFNQSVSPIPKQAEDCQR